MKPASLSRSCTSRPWLGRLAASALAVGLVTAAVAMATPRAAWAQAEDDLREGDRYFEEGEWRKAAAAYDTAIRKYPGQVPAEAYGKRAAIFIILKDLKGGLQFIRQVAKVHHPNAPEVLEQEALIQWELGSKSDAVAIAEKVVAAKPSTFTNQKLIGEFYASRDPVKTVAAYQAYLANRPAELEGGDVLPRVRLGFAYLALARVALHEDKVKDVAGYYDRAVDQFETVAKKHGKRAHAMVNAENGLCAAYAGQRRFDQAITVCERIIQDPRRIDANGSVWFNLGVAYLAKRQPQRARTAGNEYVRLRKSEARGYLLIGDSYFLERDWTNSLEYYLRAEKLLKPNQKSEQVDVSIKLGKTYRRLPGSGDSNPNLALAIEKLETGMTANPKSVELAVELGGAYLANKQDAKALATADRLISSREFDVVGDDQKTGLLVVAAKALYNQNKLKESRQRFEAAYALRPKDVQVRRGVVDTINVQAYQAVQKQDYKVAQTLLDQALDFDPKASTTSLNLAVLAIDRGDCEGGQKHLDKIKGAKGADAATYERLMARTFMCGSKTNPKKAAEHFEAADKEARRAQDNLLQAEINTEWAPLLPANQLDEAVDKLQTAVQFSLQTPEIAGAAKRNLALALFRRGWRSMKEGKAGEAVADFERANREPGLLRGTEPAAFEFSYALALLERGDTSEASKMFKGLASKGNQGAYLKPPYNKVGSQFFSAYASYRSGNVTLRQQAAGEFVSLQGGASGQFAAKVRDLAASSWEYVAYDHWRNGKGGLASKALQSSAKFAENDIKRRVSNNRAVLDMDRGSLGVFEELGSQPPEALVNAGILHDQAGRSKEAYDAWIKAKGRGVNAPDLQKWIDAKKRIFGFGG